eukprot:4114472-Pleurochrysis_carterae.AAC.1
MHGWSDSLHVAHCRSPALPIRLRARSTAAPRLLADVCCVAACAGASRPRLARARPVHFARWERTQADAAVRRGLLDAARGLRRRLWRGARDGRHRDGRGARALFLRVWMQSGAFTQWGLVARQSMLHGNRQASNRRAW